MNAAYVSAIAALMGSAIGAAASFATTWTTQTLTNRGLRDAQEGARREKLYGDFIDETSRLLADALANPFGDPSKFVALYAIRSKLTLFASRGVVEAADQVIGRLKNIYDTDTSDLVAAVGIDHDTFDILGGFADACRDAP